MYVSSIAELKGKLKNVKPGYTIHSDHDIFFPHCGTWSAPGFFKHLSRLDVYSPSSQLEDQFAWEYWE